MLCKITTLTQEYICQNSLFLFSFLASHSLSSISIRFSMVRNLFRSRFSPFASHLLTLFFKKQIANWVRENWRKIDWREELIRFRRGKKCRWKKKSTKDSEEEGRTMHLPFVWGTVMEWDCNIIQNICLDWVFWAPFVIQNSFTSNNFQPNLFFHRFHPFTISFSFCPRFLMHSSTHLMITFEPLNSL